MYGSISTEQIERSLRRILHHQSIPARARVVARCLGEIHALRDSGSLDPAQHDRLCSMLQSDSECIEQAD